MSIGESHEKAAYDTRHNPTALAAAATAETEWPQVDAAIGKKAALIGEVHNMLCRAPTFTSPSTG